MQTLADRTNSLEEYKICQEQATRLESNIWQTAGLLGVGTAIGLITLAEKQPPFAVVLLAGVFGINASLVWWRFARRWGSIQQLVFCRMEVVEKQLRFRYSRLVKRSDALAIGHKIHKQRSGSPILRAKWTFQYHFGYDEKKKKTLSRFYDRAPSRAKDAIRNYEYRGNQPVIKLFVMTNLVLWALLVMHSALNSPQDVRYDNLMVALLAGVVLLAIDILFWRIP